MHTKKYKDTHIYTHSFRDIIESILIYIITLGRLASIIAKQALNGQKIVVVRCEELNVSGEFFRNKCMYFEKYFF